MMYKIIAILFLVLTPFFAQILIKLFELKRFGLLFTDLAFPLYAFEAFLLIKKFQIQGFLPIYFILLSLLTLILIFQITRKGQFFTYRRFIKLFWRIGFILTVISYLVLTIFIFISK